MRLKNPMTSGAGIGNVKTNQLLIGSKNGVNRSFTAPSKFIYIVNEVTPRIEINGKSAYLGRQIKEFQESAGPNTGYDTVFLKRAPRKQDELRITYYEQT